MSNSKIYFEDRSIVTPGDLIAEGDFQIPWSPYYYKIGNKYYSSITGLIEVKENLFEIVPLEGHRYIPKVGDTVIGLIEDIEIYGWVLDIKSPYSAYLPASSFLGRPVSPGEDLRRYLNLGDYVIAKIETYDRTINPILSIKGKGLGRVSSGIVIDIPPVKVPRVIGKNRSMLDTLTSETGCEILVAQNGRILANCATKMIEEVLVGAIQIIEKESHIKGLTEKIRKFLREKLGETKNDSATKTEANT
ncbi:RNA-binding protein [Sulfolobus sp. S-194]|uniref:exosome complex RNA-binding protein Rrp4 n=1 Tax=Sulfolobus sp. S-194 TaxID=2512240 RepID=UPI00143708AE|nr:exosome complex RNA-binding protein Rrp4 [Sulfolobus sp. S-194]QIW23307.1 RNA-binding protein [Sulfolobus sp. S-194]